MGSITTVSQINGDSKQEKSDDAHSTSSSHVVCGGCRKKLRSLLPVNYKEEIVELLKLAGPVVSLNWFMKVNLNFAYSNHLTKYRDDFISLLIDNRKTDTWQRTWTQKICIFKRSVIFWQTEDILLFLTVLTYNWHILWDKKKKKKIWSLHQNAS